MGTSNSRRNLGWALALPAGLPLVGFLVPILLFAFGRRRAAFQGTLLAIAGVLFVTVFPVVLTWVLRLTDLAPAPGWVLYVSPAGQELIASARAAASVTEVLVLCLLPLALYRAVQFLSWPVPETPSVTSNGPTWAIFLVGVEIGLATVVAVLPTLAIATKVVEARTAAHLAQLVVSSGVFAVFSLPFFLAIQALRERRRESAATSEWSTALQSRSSFSLVTVGLASWAAYVVFGLVLDLLMPVAAPDGPLAQEKEGMHALPAAALFMGAVVMAGVNLWLKGRARLKAAERPGP